MSNPSYMHAYYLAHRETLLARASEWSRKNRKRINANRRYRYRHDEQYRQAELNRKKEGTKA